MYLRLHIDMGKREGDSVLLKGGVLGKVRTQSVVGKGKASVYRCQSQKPNFVCSAEKRFGDRDRGANVWEASPYWEIQVSWVKHCFQAESVCSVHYFIFLCSRPEGVVFGRGRHRQMGVADIFEFLIGVKSSVRDFIDRAITTVWSKYNGRDFYSHNSR